MTTIAADRTLIRNEPVQARSTARLAALLDAAARVIDRIGYERLTTAMVAEGAGASIGTVYRYFPDRIAVLQSLAVRNVERVGDAALASVASQSDWRQAVGVVFDALVEAFRSEPGFASIRFGDTVDLRPREDGSADFAFADRLHSTLVERFSVNSSDDARVAMRAAMAVADALIARAFWTDAEGDPALIDHARRAFYVTLETQLS